VSKLASKLPLLIDNVTRGNLLQALEPVRGCLKTSSMLWMKALDLPVLPGVVVDGWSKESASSVKKFCRRSRLSEVLLRIDKRNDRWIRRRGGYILPIPEIQRTVEELKRAGMLALLLDPVSPYCDHYSITGVTIPEERKMIVEVVGPGFDASDILRSDIQPHERWEVGITVASGVRPRLRHAAARMSLMTPEQYSKTVHLRLAKIGARSKNPAFPDDVLKSGLGIDELSRSGANFLRDTQQTLLLKHAEEYDPIPEKHISIFARYVEALLSGLSAYGIHLGPSSFAASLIPKRGLTFWDFFPAKKHEAASLYPAI
jgi:hypothetical protein